MEGGSSEIVSQISKLLKPIRELASNWDVDIACELEDYLSKLSKIDLSANGVQINFAEAALLIQGSAAIYSKKVEYLYSVLLRTLDHVSQQEAQRIAKKPSSIREDGKDEDVFEEEPLEFLSLDDIVEENMADNIDLQEEWECEERASDFSRPNSTTQQRAALRFAFSLGNSAAVPAPSTSMDIPSLDNPRINGSDFRMNSCFLSPSGALMLGSSLDLLVQPFGATLKTPSLPQLSEFKSTSLMELSEPSPVSQPEAPRIFDHTEENDHSMAGNDDDDDDDHNDADNRDWIRPEFSVIDNEQDSENGLLPGEKGSTPEPEKAQLSAQDQQVLKEIVDPWTMHDPHNPGSIPPKPFVKGVTFRKPKNTSKMGDFYGGRSNSKAKAEDMLAGVALLDLNFGLNKPFLPEFSYIFEEEAKKKQAERLRTRKDRIVAAAARGGVLMDSSKLELPSDENEEERDFDNDLGTDNRMQFGANSSATIGFSSFAALGNENDNDDDDDDELLVTFGTGAPKSINDIAATGSGAVGSFSDANRWDYGDDGDDRDQRGLFGQEIDGTDWETAGGAGSGVGEQWMTYEEHCKLRLEEYFRSAQQYVQETELSSRIDEWSIKLTPLLQDQESRPQFDIHTYGTRLIGSFHIESEKSLKDAVAPVTQDFQQLFIGAPAYEVSRTFSSMLQLANMGNVKIIPQRNKEGLHDITLQLLSTTPGVDIDNITRVQVPYDDLSDMNNGVIDNAAESAPSKATSRAKAKRSATTKPKTRAAKDD